MKFVTGPSLTGLCLTAVMVSAGGTHAQGYDPEPEAGYKMLSFAVYGRAVTETATLETPADAGGTQGLSSIAFKVRHQWPGVYFTAAFTGDEVVARFDDAYNRYRILVDGNAMRTVSRPGDAAVRITGLGAGKHVVRVEKLNESQSETGTFSSFFIPKASTELPLPHKNRQIEFIGDSYTVGYGNMSMVRTCTQEELWATTDTQQAFGPLTAKHYDADYQINAFSGRGIVRNYDGFLGDPLPALYPYRLFDKAQAYDNSSWQPQIVIVALGGNDFSTPVHGGEKWADDDALRADYEESYVAFVKQLRTRYPQAQIILGTYGEDNITRSVKTVLNRVTADGVTHVSLFEAEGPFELMGCDWHLNAADDQRISAQLIAYLDAHPEFWQGK